MLQAEQYDGQVLLAHENDDFQVIEEWEPVTKGNVQTPLDVYKCLNGMLHDCSCQPQDFLVRSVCLWSMLGHDVVSQSGAEFWNQQLTIQKPLVEPALCSQTQ